MIVNEIKLELHWPFNIKQLRFDLYSYLPLSSKLNNSRLPSGRSLFLEEIQKFSLDDCVIKRGAE